MNPYVFSTLLVVTLITETVQQTERKSVTEGSSSHEKEKRYLRRKKINKLSSKSPRNSKKKNKKATKKKKANSTKGPTESKKKKGDKKGKKVPKKCSFLNDGTNIVYDDDGRLITNIEDMYKNGVCDAQLNSKECGFDGGDCEEFNELYPDCSVPQPSWVGDKTCDGLVYNTTECGYDGGDCLDVIDFGCSGGGNGYCENIFNNEQCKYDGGDCLEFNRLYPGCKVPDPSYVGDGVCDIGPYYTLECGWDGGDCANFPQNCTIEDTYAIGDGYCQIEFNTTECEHDGGDCIRT